MIAVGAAAGVGAAAYVAYSSQQQSNKQDVVVFLDGSLRGLTLPRENSLLAHIIDTYDTALGVG